MNKENWIVKGYDKDNKFIGEFRLENRTEEEAERESWSDANCSGFVDWTMEKENE